MNAKGLWHLPRQICFQPVNWYAPAATKMPPARVGSQRDSAARAGSCEKPTWARYGTMPLADQTARYPATNTIVGYAPPPRFWTTDRWASTIGATVGSIIATIMPVHMTRNRVTPMSPWGREPI